MLQRRVIRLIHGPPPGEGSSQGSGASATGERAGVINRGGVKRDGCGSDSDDGDVHEAGSVTNEMSDATVKLVKDMEKEMAEKDRKAAMQTGREGAGSMKDTRQFRALKRGNSVFFKAK